MEVEVHARPVVPPADHASLGSACAIRSPIAAAWPSRDQLEAARFRHESPHVRVKQLFTDYSADCFPAGRPILAAPKRLIAKLHRDIKYAPGETNISTLADGGARKAARRLPGLRASHDRLPAFARPAGALRERLSAHERHAAGRRELVGDGASHAWVAVCSPPFGWIELDPTNGVCAGTDHIAIAWGRDFGDVSPLRGVILGGAEHKFSVTVLVESIAARSLGASTERT